ncbi:hypothetical protein THF1C08_30360 [Vibrio jasicida]|uniref:Uncharacterized protein n=1 Tax=Vibrio jasicida TaxID=766224 RepID=A0AAU9QSV9_9VIBR|nr:hypothetical protein THF1C08_30360 [Vibrio jasicida]CAH1599254.1 hypothetical protein THF1A12_40074 [Vibrio jasicida]
MGSMSPQKPKKRDQTPNILYISNVTTIANQKKFWDAKPPVLILATGKIAGLPKTNW